jgi:hypothetical protein
VKEIGVNVAYQRSAVAICAVLSFGCQAYGDGDFEPLQTGTFAAPILLVTSKSSGRCELTLRDSDLNIRSVVFEDEMCPDDIYLVDSTSSLLFEQGDRVWQFRVSDGEFSIEDFAPPEKKSYLIEDVLSGVEYIDEVLKSDRTTLQLSALGVFSDGALAVVLTANLPGDDQYSIGLKRVREAWVFAEAKYCHRFQYPCEIDSVEYRRNEIKHPSAFDDIWGVDESKNKNVTSYESTVFLNEGGRPIASVELTTDISGVSSSIVALGTVSPDTAEIHPYSIEIEVGASTARSADLAACGASIHAHLLLLNGCGSDNGVVYDLAGNVEALPGLRHVILVPNDRGVDNDNLIRENP